MRERPALGRPTIWLWAVLASLLLHGLLMGAALTWRQSAKPNLRRVVPVEAITLTKVRPGPQGGGGGEPAPVKAAPPSSLKKISPPKPIAKSKPRRQVPKAVKEKESATPSSAPPPPALALPRPAPAARTHESPSGSAVLQPIPGSGHGSGSQGGGRGTGSGSGTGSGTGSGAGPGRGSGGGSILHGYLREVRRLLERQKEYPSAARRMNLQGVAVLQFTIAQDGKIETTRLCRSSGHGLLDDAAQETVKRVGEFPPLPPALGKTRLTLEIPLAFRLQNN